MGFPLIATPMVTLLLDIRTAVTILVIPNIVMDFTQAFRRGSPTPVFRRFGRLLFMTVLGVFLGTKTLVILPIWILNLSLGIMVVIFAAANLFESSYQVSPQLEGILSPIVGFISGFLNGMTNVSGPALAIYLYSLRLKKTDFVKSISTIFIVNKLGQLVAITTWNLLTPWNLALSVFVTFLIMTGFYLGLKTQDFVNQKVFNSALRTLIFIFGVVLIVHALS